MNRTPGYVEGCHLLFFRSLIGLWLLASVCQGGDSPVLSLSSGDGIRPASGHLRFLAEGEERDAAAVFDVPADRWTKSPGTPNLGFTTRAYWFRLQLRSVDPVDGFLAITYPVLDNVRVHEFTPDGRRLADYQFGDMQSGPAAGIANRYFLMPLRLAENEQRVFLIRVETQGSLQLPLSYFDRQHFYDREQQTLLVEGVYFGILLIMVVYNFFIFLVLREPGYVWYSVFVLTFLVFQVSLEGFGYQFLWRHWPAVNGFILPFCIAACMGSGAVFSLRFLNPGAEHPRITALFRLTVLAGVVGMILSLSGAYGPSIRFSVAAAGVMAMFAIWAGFYLWRRGVSHARYYALGWSFLMPTIAVLSLNKQGMLPVNFITDYAIQIGSVIEATLFSFALGDRIALERRAKIEEQAMLLDRERDLRAELQESHRQELLAQQKMVAAEAESRAKSRFLATMSHEIRTPLNGVLGMIELLQASGLSPAQRTYADVIARSGQTLLSVINDILDFSKISAGKMQLEALDFDLEQLCSECVSAFAYNAGKSRIELLLLFDPHAPVFMHGDPTRIRQVLINLLGNAVKFTEKGRITLRVGLKRSDEGEFIRFVVSDTGIGISEELQERLFDTFAQADVSTTRRYGGTGLGLAISKQLTLLMGGAIGLESRTGEGSAFWFTIPYQAAEPEQAQQYRQGLQAISGKHVVLADGSRDFLEMVAGYLPQWGVHSQGLADGPALMAQLEHMAASGTRPDLVVLSTDLPELNGLACSRLMQVHPVLSGVPRVLLTGGYPAPGDAEWKAAGIGWCQPRPVSGRGFLELLLEWQAATQPTGKVQELRGSATPRHAGRTVLVVDDNEVNLTVITAILKKLEMRVLQARDGAQAVDYAARHHAGLDLILMDCEMPGLDGFAATQRIRALETEAALPPLPIIALTAHALPEYQARCLACGMSDYLAKPVQLRVLSARLAALWPTGPE